MNAMVWDFGVGSGCLYGHRLSSDMRMNMFKMNLAIGISSLQVYFNVLYGKVFPASSENI
jgi:hypothetical protein